MRNEIIDNVADILAAARYRGGLSQDALAKKLHVSKKTVQNWESGITPIPFASALSWFSALDVPIYPYIMALSYPHEIASINAASDVRESRRALDLYVKELDDFHANELLYLLHGEHGSSPTGMMDIVTAYLHLPLLSRALIAETILNSYELYGGVGVNSDGIAPKTETLKKCIDNAKKAVLSNKKTYIIRGEE